MNGILIFLAIIVISSMFGAISRWLKNQQLEEQARLARQRAGQRARAQGGNQQDETTVDTIDRYVAEIERLRQRKTGERPREPQGARVVTPPVVKPRRPVARPVTTQPPIRLEALPVAPVVRSSYLSPTPSPTIPVIVTPGGSLFPQAAEAGESPITGLSVQRADGRPVVTRAKLSAVPPLLALLSTPQGLFTAMALVEVLGPCRAKKPFERL